MAPRRRTIRVTHDVTINYQLPQLQWRSQPQPDARAHIFSKQLVVQVITTIMPVYIWLHLVSHVHSLIFVVLKK